MKRRILALSLALLMLVALCACGGNDTPPASTTDDPTGTAPSVGGKLTFGTGGDQGTYYGFGSVLAQAISSKTNTSVTAVTSGGSQDNVDMMAMGNYQLGFVQTDVMSYAYEGTNLFAETGKVDNFSVVAALYMEQVQIVTTNPEIKSVADLAGKNVSIGAPGSGVYYNAIDILAAYDLTEQDITPTYQNFGDSVDALQDGKIDAAFVVAGAPTVAVTTLATSKQVYLVSLDDEHIEKLIEASPYYSKYVIPEGTYDGVAEATTVAVGAVIIATDDVAEADIYNVVSTIYENVDTLAHDKASELNLEFAASITNIPYHSGAAKYFAEKGIEVPVK